MKKVTILLVIIIALFYYASDNQVNAQDGQPNYATADVFVSVATDAVTDNNNLRIAGSNGGSCSTTLVTLVKFSVSEIVDSSVIDTATVSFTVQNTGFAGTPVSLALYEAGDSWGESDLAIIVDPADANSIVGAALNSSLTFNAPPGDASTIQFPTSTQLRDYLRAQADGDDVVSIAVRMTGCPTGTSIIRLEDSEGGISVAPVLTMLNPTAIQLNNTEASDGTNTSFIWLAIALPLFVFMVVLILRRRGQIA
ncbi:MAG: hypothetical protein H6668_21560 [Ardenticatenaceae bacterium]|nr:hypothetical protein [Ardenticatenaceae bacterium]